jgi:hypothetical protein
MPVKAGFNVVGTGLPPFSSNKTLKCLDNRPATRHPPVPPPTKIG